MSSVVVSQVVGPLGSVGGRRVVVPDGEPVSAFLLAEVFSSVPGLGPWFVRVTDNEETFDVGLSQDGVVWEAGELDRGRRPGSLGRWLHRWLAAGVLVLRRWWALLLPAAGIAVVVIILVMVLSQVSDASAVAGPVPGWDGGTRFGG